MVSAFPLLFTQQQQQLISSTNIHDPEHTTSEPNGVNTDVQHTSWEIQESFPHFVIFMITAGNKGSRGVGRRPEAVLFFAGGCQGQGKEGGGSLVTILFARVMGWN